MGAEERQVEVFLALGSNLGDRKANIHRALDELSLLPGTSVEAVSELIVSRAEGKWVGGTAGEFLNGCCRIFTSLKPLQLLQAVKGIEQKMGREEKKMTFDDDGARLYSDRLIDIDILLYGDEKINLSILQIPHPRMWERDFVMTPLKQINDNIK